MLYTYSHIWGKVCFIADVDPYQPKCFISNQVIKVCASAKRGSSVTQLLSFSLLPSLKTNKNCLFVVPTHLLAGAVTTPAPQQYEHLNTYAVGLLKIL